MYHFILFAVDLFLHSICIVFSFTLLFLRKIPLHLKLCPFYLILIFAIKIIGLKVEEETGTNHRVYNYGSVLNFEFYLIVLWRILKNSRIKQIALIACLCFPILAVANLFFLQGFDSYNTYSHSAGSILIVIFSIYCLYELFTLTPSNISPTQVPEIWLCLGFLIFFSVTFVAFNAIQEGIQHSEGALQILGLLLVVPEYFLFFSFSIAFLCALNQQPGKDPIPPTTPEFDPEQFSF